MVVVKILIVICIILSATVQDARVYDRALTVRLMVWGMCLVLLCLSHSKFPVPKNMLLLCFCGYILCSSLSLFYAMSPVEGMFELARNVLMLLTLCIFGGVENKEFIFRALTLLGLGLGIMGICQYEATYMQGLSTVKCYGLMCNRNPWSHALLLLLPFCIYTFGYWKWISVASISVILFNLAFLFNRTSVLALCVAGVVLALINKRWRYYILGGFGLLCVLCGIFFSPTMVNSVSMSYRWEYWRESMNIVQEFPVFGIGIGNWIFEIPRFGANINIPNIFNKLIPQRAHNDWIQTLCETGVAGLICYLGIFVFAFYYAVKKKSHLALAGLSIYSVIAFFSFPRERPFLCMLLLVYLSSVMPRNIIRSRIAVYVAVVLAFVVCAELTSYHLGERALAKMRYYTNRLQFDKVIEAYNGCTFVNPITTTGLPAKWYSGNAYLWLGRNYQGIRDSRTAFRQNPNNIFVLERMGCIWREKGNYEQARACFTRALGIAPHFESSRDHLEKLINLERNKR